jgi:hypothetical protein
MLKMADVAGRVLSPSLGGACSRKYIVLHAWWCRGGGKRAVRSLCARRLRQWRRQQWGWWGGGEGGRRGAAAAAAPENGARREGDNETRLPIFLRSPEIQRIRSLSCQVQSGSLQSDGDGTGAFASSFYTHQLDAMYYNSSMVAAASASSSSSSLDIRIQEFSSSSLRVDISRKEILDEEEKGMSKF